MTSATGVGSVAFDRSHTDDLITFLQTSPSPFHAVATAAERLEKAGFRQVEETAAWEGTPGGRYLIRGGALIAWYTPEGADPSTRSGSSACTPTRRTCGSSRSRTPARRAGGRSPWRSTAGRC